MCFYPARVLFLSALIAALSGPSGCRSRSETPTAPSDQTAAASDQKATSDQATSDSAATSDLPAAEPAAAPAEQAAAQPPVGTPPAEAPASQPSTNPEGTPHGAAATQHGPATPHPANRLAQETSPYLRAHAHNPVDWYPWGPEAFDKAKRENKVIFLSIGYSSCHWCHVMERESFMDEEIAGVLNQHYVCVKVDREERPDVDDVYMTAVQVFNQLTGSGRGGGWPLSAFLTPEGEPFFGGTYFPARDGDRGATTGFLTLIQRVHAVWGENEARVREDAQTITRVTKGELENRLQALQGQLPPDGGWKPELFDAIEEALAEQFDEEHGGFGFSVAAPNRPKFPEPSNLFFLLDRIARRRTAGQDDQRALKMLTKTLDEMLEGGIRDHLGGGFHRYSVDRYWRIPHFEKMLYDNGQLLSVYADAFALTQNPEYRRVAVEMADFVLREMTAEGGGFYAALDADSEGEEGKFYVFTAEEVRALVSPDDWPLIADYFQLEHEPNFEEKSFALQPARSLEEVAARHMLNREQCLARLTPVCDKLLTARGERIRPLTDTKILTSWNGLMIRGLADAGRQLEEPRYLEAAEQAAEFVLAKLRTSDGRLLRTYGEGQAKLNAYLDDYAFLTDGLLALHRATQDEQWLLAAEQLTDKQLELFWDEAGHGFFFTSDDHETLLARAKQWTDNVLPAGNSMSAGNLLQLAEVRGRDDLREKAVQLLEAGRMWFRLAPSSVPRLAIPANELVPASPPP